MSKHEQTCATEKFADISQVVQPSPSAKKAWCSTCTCNFIITVSLVHSACLLHFYYCLQYTKRRRKVWPILSCQLFIYLYICTCNRQQRRGSLTEKLFAVSECWSSEHLWSGKFAVHCKVRSKECVRKLCSFI